MIDQYDHAFSNPFDPAAKMLVDSVIEPRYTRPALVKALNMLITKVEERPWRKHGNIPRCKQP